MKYLVLIFIIASQFSTAFAKEIKSNREIARHMCMSSWKVCLTTSIDENNEKMMEIGIGENYGNRSYNFDRKFYPIKYDQLNSFKVKTGERGEPQSWLKRLVGTFVDDQNQSKEIIIGMLGSGTDDTVRGISYHELFLDQNDYNEEVSCNEDTSFLSKLSFLGRKDCFKYLLFETEVNGTNYKLQTTGFQN